MQMAILKKKMGNKFLIFVDSVNENKALLIKYADVWDGIEDEIKAINGGEENDYGKDYMKLQFNSDDDLRLNKPLKLHAMAITIRSIFGKGGLLRILTGACFVIFRFAKIAGW